MKYIIEWINAHGKRDQITTIDSRCIDMFLNWLSTEGHSIVSISQGGTK